MSEISHSNEACKAAKKSPSYSLIARFRESKLGAVFSLISALVVTGCAPELRRLKPTDDHRARTHRNADGTHGFDEIVVYPTSSPDKEFRCVIKPECRELGKDEKRPEPKDCVDWSEPCEKQ